MNTNGYLGCGLCDALLAVVSPTRELTKEVSENGGEIDSLLVFECPNKDDGDEHTRIIFDLKKIREGFEKDNVSD